MSRLSPRSSLSVMKVLSLPRGQRAQLSRAITGTSPRLSLILSVDSQKEIERSKINLHMVYCMKNITKCPYCKVQVDVKELQTHIDDAQKQDLAQAALTGNLEALRKVQQHGGDLSKYQNEADAMNSLLHYAVKGNQSYIVEYFAFL